VYPNANGAISAVRSRRLGRIDEGGESQAGGLAGMRYLAIVFAGVMVLLVAASASAQQVIPIKLYPENNSGISGTATLSGQGNQTKVIIDLTGQPAGASMPVHIHRGQCGPTLDPKPVDPLHSVEGGTSTTVVNVPLRSLTTGRYAINVHESAANISHFVACGNIPSEANG
jgi:hypothetical protein